MRHVRDPAQQEEANGFALGLRVLNSRCDSGAFHFDRQDLRPLLPHGRKERVVGIVDHLVARRDQAGPRAGLPIRIIRFAPPRRIERDHGIGGPDQPFVAAIGEIASWREPAGVDLAVLVAMDDRRYRDVTVTLTVSVEPTADADKHDVARCEQLDRLLRDQRTVTRGLRALANGHRKRCAVQARPDAAQTPGIGVGIFTGTSERGDLAQARQGRRVFLGEDREDDEIR